jgi:nitrite reductase/ring-hydroxylating ferredoxin subunit
MSAEDERRQLCRQDDLAEGQARGFAVPGFERKIILVRRKERVYAYLDACPHYDAGTPMAWKTDAYLNGARTHLACHSHGALFDIETGDCVIGPCLGRSLTRIPVSINQAGGVEIAVEPVWEGAA